MSQNKDNKMICGEDDDEDLETLRLMALQSRKNKPTIKPAVEQEHVSNDDSEESDSSVDSLDKLIQDMDYELLDTPKEERVYSKRKKIKKTKPKVTNKVDSIPTAEVLNKDEIVKPVLDSKSTNVLHESAKEQPEINDVINDNNAAAKIETIGSRIPILGEVVPLNVPNSHDERHEGTDVLPTRHGIKRSRSRSWSRESIPYRRSRFSRSPEHRSIFPDLTNVQLSPRALAFVYNNTGILIKRRDRRSSSSSVRDYSSDSSSRSRRSISPYSRTFKDASPQPSHSGQIHNLKPIRRSRSNSRSKSRLGLCRQRIPSKGVNNRVPRKWNFRNDIKRAPLRKEPAFHNRRRQRSCSISLSPSPEPVTKHPMNFGRVHYTGFNSRNRASKFNQSRNTSDTNHSKNISDHKNSRSNDSVKVAPKENDIRTDHKAQSANTADISANQNTDSRIDENVEKNPSPDITEDAIELNLDTSMEDVWSSESSDEEREGRFKTNSNKEVVAGSNTKISFSAKNSVKPICVSLDEIINKERPTRMQQGNRKCSRGSRMFRDNWEKRNRSNSHSRISRDDRHKSSKHSITTNKYDKSNADVKSGLLTNGTVDRKIIKDSQSTSDVKKVEAPAKRVEVPIKKVEAPIKKVEAPIKKVELPIKKAEAPNKKVEVPIKKIEAPVKKVDTPSRKIDVSPTKIKAPKRTETIVKNVISLKPKQEQKDISDQKSVTLDKKFTDAIKKSNDLKADEDLRDTLQQRRVKQLIPLKSQQSSSSRLVQSALMGAVASRTEAKRTGKLPRNENNAENVISKTRPNIRHVLWVNSDDKELKVENTKQNAARVPVRLRLGVGDQSIQNSQRSTSNKKRRRRGISSKHSNEDLHQV
ncbi:uncharacterized protein LOC113376993 isoform X3 [Ctenocephalides felis]|nr:uncharacterized protein LOC113376993 isoform X3 [Ctenocephalides felis]